MDPGGYTNMSPAQMASAADAQWNPSVGDMWRGLPNQDTAIQSAALDLRKGNPRPQFEFNIDGATVGPVVPCEWSFPGGAVTGNLGRHLDATRSEPRPLRRDGREVPL
jgi:hypothetical protein